MISFMLFLASIPGAFGFGCCAPCVPCHPPPCPPPPPACPPPLPPPICPPLPPPCPPPIICPPPACPPPIICPPPPPPLPPPPPPICPPPLPLLPPPCPQTPAYVPPPVNDCCCMCANPCHYSRTKMHGARIFSAATAELEYDPMCSDTDLKTLMQENMVADPSEAKRLIQKAAEEKFDGNFNVICSKNDFSYVAYTETFCQATSADITCYAFKPN